MNRDLVPDRPGVEREASVTARDHDWPLAGTDAADAERSRGFALPTDLRELLDADRTAVVMLGFDMIVRDANETALALLGATTLESLRPGTASHSMLLTLLDHAPRDLVAGLTDGTWHGDIDHTDAFGERVEFRATVAARRDSTMYGDGFLGLTAHDVTAARHEASQLRHRATHDPLTGLANRRHILTMLSQSIAAHRGRSDELAVIFIDFDRLKFVNDALGHQVGDQLLIAGAQRLLDSVRPGDQVARIGGDEFVVVCNDLPDVSAAMEVADRIRRALTGTLRLRQIDLAISVSIGLATADDSIFVLDDAAAAAQLISNADTAMYEAKTLAHGRCVAYTPAMHSASRERTALSAELASAINHRELTIHYQPVFSTVTNALAGAEALVRWDHPVKGPMEPAEFISIAEESATIGPLGEFVLEQALAETRRWIDGGVVGDDFSIHVNVSPLQLASSSFVVQVETLLHGHHLAPRRLVLEVRESALLGRNADVDRSVRTLRRLGVQIAIDNFGTGANSLALLTDLGADILKLDGSLALPAGSTDSDTKLVRAVVLLAHALDMRVVAERVTDNDQLRRLRSAGCDLAQGNLLAPPEPPDRLAVVPAN